MLSGSAFLRVVVLLIVAAGLAGIIQLYWSPAPVDADPDPVVIAAEPTRPVRRAEPAPAVPSPPTPVPPAPVPQAQALPPPAPVPAAPQPAAPSPTAPLSFQPSIAAGEDSVASASDNAGPRAMAIVDLNSASVADLNGLKGGGMIGRAIVQKRPYASVDQLLSKRVLSRATYERIKDQVTVR